MCKKQTILLTGGTGFLGSHLLNALLEKDYSVVLLKRSTSNTWRIKHLLSNVQSYDVDLVSMDEIFRSNQIDAVIHTACHYGRNGDSISSIVESNLMFGLKVLDACITGNVKTFINTDSLLPKNLNTYSLSKKQFSEWLEQLSDQIQVINLKLEHMYGPKDDSTKFISWIMSQLKENVAEIRLTKGEQLRDFIHIEDIVSAYILILDKAPVLRSFNEFEVGTGSLISVKDFLERLLDAPSSTCAKVENEPIKINRNII